MLTVNCEAGVLLSTVIFLNTTANMDNPFKPC